MAEHDEQDPKETPGEKIDRLEKENAELRQQFFIANEIQLEMRQALANCQFALARSNAQLKLIQPTA